MTATDQNPQQSAQPTPRKTINVVGAAIVKDGKVLARNAEKADHWLVSGSFRAARSNRMKRRVRHCIAKSKKSCCARSKLPTKCARLLTITISAPSCSRRSCAI